MIQLVGTEAVPWKCIKSRHGMCVLLKKTLHKKQKYEILAVIAEPSYKVLVGGDNSHTHIEN